MLVVPLAILVATYALMASGQSVLLTSIAMYAAIWHRGRQSFGIARFYQGRAGGPISRLHSWLFAGAIYLPMAAATFLYCHLAPEKYEGEPYYALGVGADFSWGLGLIAAVSIVAYNLDIAPDAAPAPIEHWANRELETFIRVSVGLCLPTPWPLAAPMCSVLRMLRFSWSLSSTTRCNTSISPMPWRGGQWPPINRRTRK